MSIRGMGRTKAATLLIAKFDLNQSLLKWHVSDFFGGGGFIFIFRDFFSFEVVANCFQSLSVSTCGMMRAAISMLLSLIVVTKRSSKGLILKANVKTEASA